MASEALGRTPRRLRRLASLTQEELAERSGVSVDVIRQLEQGPEHSARLPTRHALAHGLGVELTRLLGDPPAVSASGENDGPRFVAARRAVMPVLWGPEPEPPGPDFSLERLRERIADGWTQYHAAEFDTVMKALPDLISDARTVTASTRDEDRRAGFAALGKALQPAGPNGGGRTKRVWPDQTGVGGAARGVARRTDTRSPWGRYTSRQPERLSMVTPRV